MTDFQLIFNYLDANHNGIITSSEFRLILEKEHTQLTKDEIVLSKELE